MFNINIYPIQVKNGKYNNTLPGLFSITPPRKCARGRESDLLVGLLHLNGKTTITTEALQDWLKKKCAAYYSTAGTVTSAMRSLVMAINADLLDRNIKKARDGSQVNGSLSLVVIRRNMLYHLIVGRGQLFLLSGKEATMHEDTENPSRGLGMSENIVFRFGQVEIHDKDVVLLSPQTNNAWTVESLSGGAGLSAEALSRRIFNQAPSTLDGALIRFLPGNGQFSYKSVNYIENLPSGDSSTAIDSDQEEHAISEPEPVAVDNFDEESKETTEFAQPVSAVELKPTAVEFRRAGLEQTRTEKRAIPRSDTSREKRSNPRELMQNDELKAQVDGYVRSVNEFQSKALTSFSKFLSRLLPGKAIDSPALSRTVLLITAIIIPIIVVALASSVYIRKGKSQQFELYFLQGQQYAMQAESLKNDPPARLASLQQALYFLEKASNFGQKQESESLRQQIRNELDSMQGIIRLNLVPISSVGLPGNVNISQMAATATDLYLLDEKSGKAFRYYLSGSEYIQDVGFDCGPNPANPLNSIGNLVDIAPLATGNSFNSSLFGIDEFGNIEFCTPGDSGRVGALIPPDAGWRKIRSISIFQNYLYVLDTEGNAVYRYREVDRTYGEKPSFYFDSNVPQLTNAIDIEVNGDELYILRSTGEMVECTYSHIKDYKLTECKDPAPYGDMRTGESPQAISFPDAQFIQMRMTAAPDSSLYLLDANGRSIYHFSLQRNLQKVFHPGFADEGLNPRNTPTAVSISPGKMVFVAYKDQIFYAPLP